VSLVGRRGYMHDEEVQEIIWPLYQIIKINRRKLVLNFGFFSQFFYMDQLPT